MMMPRVECHLPAATTSLAIAFNPVETTGGPAHRDCLPLCSSMGATSASICGGCPALPSHKLGESIWTDSLRSGCNPRPAPGDLPFDLDLTRIFFGRACAAPAAATFAETRPIACQTLHLNAPTWAKAPCSMPGLEAGSYQPRLEVPLGLRANEEVFVCRYTGQIFREYE